MTGVTAFRGFFITGVEVAAAAGNLHMFSREWELGYVMIKIKLVPAFGVMAFSTLLTEVTFVRILIVMTVEAAGRCFRVLLV